MNNILKFSALSLSILMVGCTTGGSGKTDGTTSLTGYLKSATGANDEDITVVEDENGITVDTGTKVYTFASGSSVSNDGTIRVLQDLEISQSNVSITPLQIGADLGSGGDVQDVAVGVVGNKTLESDLPSGEVNYAGTYLVGSVEVGEVGGNTDFSNDESDARSFTAIADFGAAKTITAAFSDDGKSVDMNGTITGNSFSGTVAIPDGPTLASSGGFYGPQAAEIAGTVSGQISEDNGTFDIILGFAGTKQ